jgi:hypothetical protein
VLRLVKMVVLRWIRLLRRRIIRQEIRKSRGIEQELDSEVDQGLQSCMQVTVYPSVNPAIARPEWPLCVDCRPFCRFSIRYCSGRASFLCMWRNRHAYAIFLAMPYQCGPEIISKAVREWLKNTQTRFLLQKPPKRASRYRRREVWGA